MRLIVQPGILVAALVKEEDPQVPRRDGLASPGDELLYQVTVINSGLGAATAVALADPLPAATTLVAATTPRKHAGYALGMLQMAIYSGSSMGPLLGGIVADAFGYRATFWVTGVLLFVAGVVFAFFVTSPFLLHFLWSLYEGLGWSNTWTVRGYYGFLTRFLLVSGLTFELPLVLDATQTCGLQ